MDQLFNQIRDPKLGGFKIRVPEISRRKSLAVQYVKKLEEAVLEKGYSLSDHDFQQGTELEEDFLQIAIWSLNLEIQNNNDEIDLLKILRTKLYVDSEYETKRDRPLLHEIQMIYEKLKSLNEEETLEKLKSESDSILLCKSRYEAICEKCLNEIEEKSSKTEFRRLLYRQKLQNELQIKELKVFPFVRPSVKLLKEKILANQNLVKLLDFKINEIKDISKEQNLLDKICNRKNSGFSKTAKFSEFHQECFKKEFEVDIKIMSTSNSFFTNQTP